MQRLLFLILFSFSVFSLERRQAPQSMKTSVIIPCHVDHFPLLENLLAAFEMQTRVPDEVVISLSEAGSVPADQIAALEQRQRPFALKLLKQKGKYPPGKNRNEACAASAGDLLICQDADDLPHPQRMEIIQHLFENYQINHLLHQWIPKEGSFIDYKIDDLEGQCTYFKYYFQLNEITHIHNGSASFVRSLFDTIHWKPQTAIQEDVLFNQMIYVLSTNKAVLKLPLLMYRFELSTFDLDGTK